MCVTNVLRNGSQKQTKLIELQLAVIHEEISKHASKEIEQIALFINFMESLILAQDERWRRA